MGIGRQGEGGIGRNPRKPKLTESQKGLVPLSLGTTKTPPPPQGRANTRVHEGILSRLAAAATAILALQGIQTSLLLRTVQRMALRRKKMDAQGRSVNSFGQGGCGWGKGKGVLVEILFDAAGCLVCCLPFSHPPGLPSQKYPCIKTKHTYTYTVGR